MNSITFYHKKGSAAKIEMTISTELLNQLKDLMDIEIELLKGLHEKLDKDMNHCIIEVSGYKRQIFLDFFRMLANHPAMTLTMMGLTVNKN
jgi:hypothetical protein